MCSQRRVCCSEYGDNPCQQLPPGTPRVLVPRGPLKSGRWQSPVLRHSCSRRVHNTCSPDPDPDPDPPAARTRTGHCISWGWSPQLRTGRGGRVVRNHSEPSAMDTWSCTLGWGFGKEQDGAVRPAALPPGPEAPPRRAVSGGSPFRVHQEEHGPTTTAAGAPAPPGGAPPRPAPPRESAPAGIATEPRPPPRPAPARPGCHPPPGPLTR